MNTLSYVDLKPLTLFIGENGTGKLQTAKFISNINIAYNNKHENVIDSDKLKKLSDFLKSDILYGIYKNSIYGGNYSMITGVYYLHEYILRHDGSLLIINEPENGLHPSVQVEIAEFFGMMVNAGLNLLIVTYSPYIVDHIANMMQAAKHDDCESIKELFYLEQPKSFITQDKVSIVLFEKGESTRQV